MKINENNLEKQIIIFIKSPEDNLIKNINSIINTKFINKEIDIFLRNYLKIND